MNFAKIALVMTAAFCLGAASAGAKSAILQTGSGRPVTVVDSIESRIIAQDNYYAGGDPEYPIERTSPNKLCFFVVVRQGKVADNTNRYTFLMWNIRGGRIDPTPHQVLEIASKTNRPGIAAARWLDNDTIAFLGTMGSSPTQVFRLKVSNHALSQLTHSETNIRNFDITSDGRTVAYINEAPVHQLFAGKAARDGVVVTNQSIWQLLNGRTAEWWQGDGNLYIVREGETDRMVVLKDSVRSFWSKVHISPNGRFAIVTANPFGNPGIWGKYDDEEIKTIVRDFHYGGAEKSILQRYWLVDIDSGSGRVLLNSPVSRTVRTDVAWAPDSNSIAISGVFLPLSSGAIDGSDTKRSDWAVIVDRSGSVINKLGNGDFIFKGWSMDSGSLMADQMDNGHRVRVQWSDPLSNVSKKMAAPSADNQLTVSVREDLNTPPQLWASAMPRRDPIKILDFNPQFKFLKFAPVKTFHWQDPSGHDRAGGLYLPVGYIEGTRYPLVLQTHGWNPKRFSIDGRYSSGFAAQALAAKGIMVLQIDEEAFDVPGDNGIDKIKDVVSSMEAAIHALDDKSQIDPTRVGIVGFSVTGITVKYALSHSVFKFAAAAVEDENDMGYLQYITQVNDTSSGPIREEWYRHLNGGYPFGAGLAKWGDRAPAFNADKVSTPMRIVIQSTPAVLNEWEWYAAMRLLNKPVDMVYTPDGDHILVKPWERMIAQGGNVDWFSFWLTGARDADPEKAEQYKRWDGLCHQQEVNLGVLNLPCSSESN